MAKFEYYKKQFAALEQGKCEYSWDELEELIMDDFDEERLTSEEYDTLMRQLMEIDCG